MCILPGMSMIPERCSNEVLLTDYIERGRLAVFNGNLNGLLLNEYQAKLAANMRRNGVEVEDVLKVVGWLPNEIVKLGVRSRSINEDFFRVKWFLCHPRLVDSSVTPWLTLMFPETVSILAEII